MKIEKIKDIKVEMQAFKAIQLPSVQLLKLSCLQSIVQLLNELAEAINDNTVRTLKEHEAQCKRKSVLDGEINRFFQQFFNLKKSL